MQIGRSLESSQIQDCSSGKRISHFNRNCNCCMSRAIISMPKDNWASVHMCKRMRLYLNNALQRWMHSTMHGMCASRTFPQNYVTLELRLMMAPRRPPVKWRPRLHSLLSTTMQTGRSLESSQIQDCSSGKLSKAFHTSTATVTAVRRELSLVCRIIGRA